MLGLVRTTFTCLYETKFSKLFPTMVGSHYNYGNVIWHPRCRRDKLEINKIQRRTIRMIPSLKGLSYEKRLRLPFFEYHRKTSDM